MSAPTFTTEAGDKSTAPPPGASLFADANFRWLLGGSFISMLGDQFTLVALPWLVLRMTGDTAALGTVLALIGVPRAVFMLVGGALVDRHSPKRVLMITKYINTALLGLLGTLVLSGSAQLWTVYLLAFAIGLSTAFSIPSGSALLPLAVPPARLQAANGIMLGLRQVTMFAGPLIAGLLIAVFGTPVAATAGAAVTGALPDRIGLGIAFLVDGLSFGASIWTLAKVNTPALPRTAGALPRDRHVLHSVADGLCHAWRDRSLRACFAYWGAIAFFIHGPIQVGMPVLSEAIGGSAGAFGALLAAHGAGTLAGMILSAVLPRMRLGSLGLTILAADAVVGVLFMPMGAVTGVWQGCVLLVLVGVLGGYLQVSIFTWMQRRVPPAMMGRTMSLFMFIFMGVAPVSAAMAGWALRSISPAQLFFGGGAMLLLIVVTALAFSPMRKLEDASPGPERGAR